MKDSELECLKTNIGQILEIGTQKGDYLLVKVISVFDHESDPDVFFFEVTSDPHKQDSEQRDGHRLPLQEIVSVKKHDLNGGCA
jgi:hypothetical protein